MTLQLRQLTLELMGRINEIEMECKKAIRDYEDLHQSFLNESKTLHLSIDYKKSCDNYLSNLLDTHLIMKRLREGCKYIKNEISYDTVARERHQHVIDVLTSLSQEINTAYDAVLYQIDMLNDNRQVFYDNRSHYLQVNFGCNEHLKEYCHCSIHQRYDRQNGLVDCSICFCEQVTGIRPDCCNRMQQICTDCCKHLMEQTYKSCVVTNGEELNISRLSSIHYTCPFCRENMCFLMHQNLFKQ